MSRLLSDIHLHIEQRIRCFKSLSNSRVNLNKIFSWSYQASEHPVKATRPIRREPYFAFWGKREKPYSGVECLRWIWVIIAKIIKNSKKVRSRDRTFHLIIISKALFLFFLFFRQVIPNHEVTKFIWFISNISRLSRIILGRSIQRKGWIIKSIFAQETCWISMLWMNLELRRPSTTWTRHLKDAPQKELLLVHFSASRRTYWSESRVQSLHASKLNLILRITNLK